MPFLTLLASGALYVTRKLIFGEEQSATRRTISWPNDPEKYIATQTNMEFRPLWVKEPLLFTQICFEPKVLSLS